MNGIILLAQAGEKAQASDSGDVVSRFGRIQAVVEETLLPAITSLEGRLILATLLAGIGLWLMLPGNVRRMKFVGVLLALLGAGSAISVLPVMGWQFESVVFWMLAGVTVSSAVATITSRSPVYCAVWFAVVLLGTGGLFMINGAQFLGVATVAVYAGAIVVTFLFVLMLAQPEGHSFYDRISWGKLPSLAGCLAGAGLAAILIGAVAKTSLDQLASATSVTRAVLAEAHVANLGGRLFTEHLIAVQVAATLLLAALVGAVAMAAHGGAQRKLLATEHARTGADGTMSNEGAIL